MRWVMECEGLYPIRAVRDAPNPALFGVSSFMHGTKITVPVPNPLVYALEKRIVRVDGRSATPKALYDEEEPPLIRADLRTALEEAGVDNIDYYPAVVKDPLGGPDLTDYFAFNILGLVSAADMKKSKLMGTSNSKLLDVDFDRLVIDESKAQGFRLFRLAENVSAIVVDDVVKASVEKHRIPGMVFYPPGQWSG